MKHLILIILFFGTVLNAYSQDSAYYHTAFNSAGDTLKENLHNIIDGHTTYPYSSSSTDVWDMLKQTDKDPNNPNNVILIYSNRSVNAAQEFNNGAGWNREHVWAKSRGDFGNTPPAGTDAHHIRPCDISVNGDRDNRNFDDCITCQDIIDNGFNTGSKKDANLWTFQPPDNVKGDVARMIFYMSVRYEGAGSEPDLELTNTLQSNTSKQPLHAVLTTLLDWNRQDTVDSFEQNRNQVIYSFQGNKNPFIDYPELAEYLWGDSLGMVWKPEVLVSSVNEIAQTNYRLYPNPSANGQFNIESNTIADKVSIHSHLGQEIFTQIPNSRNFSLDLSDLRSGVYIMEIYFPEGNRRQKFIIGR